MIASEFMTKEVVSLTQDRTVYEAAKLMLEKNISAIPIVDAHQKIIGIITESDFIGRKTEVPHALAAFKKILGHLFYHTGAEEIFKDAKTTPLGKVMTEDPKTVEPDYPLDDVVFMMNKWDLKRIPVVEKGHLVGIITRHDILKAFVMLSKGQNVQGSRFETGDRPAETH